MAVTEFGEIAEQLRRSTVLIHAEGRGGGSGVPTSVGRATFSPSAALTYQRGDGRLHVDAKEYRVKARELRELAEATQDLSVRAELLRVASQYDKLAEQAEAQERKPEKP